MSPRNEFSVFIDDARRQRVLCGLFEKHYADTQADVAFGASRAWCARLSALATLFPGSKVIACVREVPWIVDSIERLVRADAFQPSSIFNYSADGTVYTRANGITGSDGMLGYAYDALKEDLHGEHADRLLLVQHESLTSDPLRVLAAVYAFLCEPSFKHDVARVSFDAEAFDTKAGTPGLHAIRPKVQAHPRTTLLPPDLFHRFQNDAFWRDPKLNLRGVHVI